MNTPAPDTPPTTRPAAPPPAGLGCGVLGLSALIVFGYALYKYQQTAAIEAEAPAGPPRPPDDQAAPPGPPPAL